MTDTYENWFFILGTGRCGSSVLHEVVARHEDVGFISNLEDRFPGLRASGRWNNAVYRAVPASLTRKGRPRYAPSEAYRLLSAEVSPVLARPMRDLTADDLTPWMERRLRRAFERRAAAQPTAAFSHKFTGWPRAGLLAEAFPGCRFVHVVRDGRAVANSLMQMSWWGGYGGPANWRYGPLPVEYDEIWRRSGRSFTVLAGLTWRLLMDAYVAAEQAAEPGTWLTVRYEDVVADPPKYVDAILTHVGLPRSSRLDEWVARNPLCADRTDGFRRDLDAADVGALEHATRPVLERFGYTSTVDGRQGYAS